MSRPARKIFPHVFLSLFMVVFWILMTNSLSVGNIILSVFLSWIIPYFSQSFWPQAMSISHYGLALKFIFIVLWDIIIANFQVALLILGSRQKLKPAFMKIPLVLKQDFTIALLANTISLTPGTVSVDLDMEEGYLLVHALHVEDIDALVVQIKSRYEMPLKEIFECSNP